MHMPAAAALSQQRQTPSGGCHRIPGSRPSCVRRKTARNVLQQMIFARRQQQHCPLRAVSDSDRLDEKAEAAEPHEVIVTKKNLSEGTLYIGMEADANAEVPGNGGLRVRSYNDPDAAETEVVNLTEAMRKKHRMYNTGFAGAKLVFDSNIAPEDLDKKLLMKEVSRALASMNGTVYTGCDLNTTDADMAYLDELSPFVLAAIGASVDANIATADGTFAAVVRAAEELGLPKNFKVFVQGCGKVGSRLAHSLVEYGADVYVADMKKELADIPGATNISGIGATEWHTLDIDVFSPCAIAGIVTEEAASSTSAKAIIGAANVPFRDEAARQAAAEKGIIFVPEYITSAGAIIVDSLEKCTGALPDVQPSVAYKFVFDMVYAKAGEYLSQINAVDANSSSGEVTASWDEATVAVTESIDSTAAGDKLAPWMDENTRDVDVIVIGGGMAGTAAAYSLSERSPNATGVVIEAGPTTAHKGGSSYGESRMFRQMYSDKYFSDLQTQALKYWSELEQKSGETLLSENGLLFYGSPDTGETVEGSIPGCIEVMKERNLPHKEFSASSELKAEYDGIEPSDGYVGVMEETAGSVNSSLACEAMMKTAQGKGNWKLSVNTKCEDLWQSKDGKYHVLTSAGEIYRADRVVMATGPWTNNLLSKLGYEIDSQVWKVHWGHYKMKDGVQSPQWFHFGEDESLIYGFPGDKKGGIAKVGVDFSLEEDKMTTMDEFEYEPNEKVVKMIDDFVKEQWGGVYDERVEIVASPYTMTKDSMFVLDTLPSHPGVAVFSAGNGRAFKFAPVLGDALAALVMGEEPPFDISPMAIDRPGLLKTRPESDMEVIAPREFPKAAPDSVGGSRTAVVGAMAVEESPTSEEDIDAFGRAHVPYGEVGAAFYSKLTLGCFDVVYKSKDLIEQSIAAIDIKEGEMVRVADFGSADGGPMMPMVQAVRAAVPKTSDVEVVFEDQENNDFTSLFYLAKGIESLPSGVDGNTTPLAETDGVFYTACGRSFFQQCLPKDSVDLCTSYTAMHWLSKLPVHVPDGVHHTVSGNSAAIDAFASQAANDWENILTQRSKELKKGGQMVIACFGVDSEGRCLGWSNDGNAKMYEEMTKHWAAMRDEGVITDAEYRSASFPNYYRSEAELSAPFEGEKLGLKLKSIEWRYSKCPFGRGLGSPAEVVGTMRTWSNSTYTSALDSSRPEDEKKAIVDEFYGRYERTIAADPSRHHMDYVHAYIHAERM